ncbi:Aste57867_16351 [Aphanomyces stellatus]|uniref:Aste57867_16351 protein n=1 Tax=Aphanomyces stellatus TaxID=120398 RepID=A0A485L6L3_9STRA|nr:hypothetical protein As57867_016294 [Aphanomyces stellatus]VFT93127.1 Aste57867_16351 [Aphanomyces stellatus]
MSSTEDVARRWIEMVLSEKIQGELLTALQDGTILCALINQLYRSVGMKHMRVPIETEGATTTSMFSGSCRRQNVRTFLEACRFFGVPDDVLFRPNDLLKGVHPEKVFSCILALEAMAMRMARQRTPDERASMGSFATSTCVESGELKAVRSPQRTGTSSALDPQDVSKFTNASTSVAAWTALMDEYEAQQAQMYRVMPSAQEGGTPQHDVAQDTGRMEYALWCTEERVRTLARDNASCCHLTPEMHGRLWMLLSGATIEMGIKQGHFDQLLSEDSVNAESIRQIEADLPRTFADESDWTPELHAKLKRVLVAYAAHNPKLGYCQGLNYVGARLLQCCKNDEAAFWLLDRMVAMLPEDYYTTMLGVAIDQHVFAELVALQTPDIIHHIERLGGFGAELSLACTEWFCTLFGSPCRKEVTIRVWDLLFIDGNEELFRMALALIQFEYPNIMSCANYGDVLLCLNQIGRDTAMDPKLLLHIAHQQTIVTTARIEDLRAYHRLELASGIALSKATVHGTPPLSNESTSSSTKKRKHPLSNRKITARTMSRHLSMESFDGKHDDSVEAKYFPDASPQLLEDYWGQEVGPTPWNVAHFKLITSPSDAATTSGSRPRQVSDTGYRHTFSTSKSASFRETRSKSTADFHTRASYTNAPSHDTKPHSNFFKKIEEWTNKTLKKKPGVGGLTFDFSSALTGHNNFFAMGAQREKMGSPAVWETPHTPIENDFLPPPQRTPPRGVPSSIAEAPEPPPPAAPLVIEPPPPVIKMTTMPIPIHDSVMDSPPPQLPATNRIVGSRSTPSLVSLDRSYNSDDSFDEYDDLSQDEDGSSRPRSTSTNYIRPPRHHHHSAKDSKRQAMSQMLNFEGIAPPDMRRHTSMPARNGRQKKSTAASAALSNLENARVLRERAHVVSYLQRKASDVSSLTSGSPVDSEDVRDSMSSDEGTRRTHRTLNRTNSFSFLGSLSVDLERSMLLDDKDLSSSAS